MRKKSDGVGRLNFQRRQAGVAARPGEHADDAGRSLADVDQPDAAEALVELRGERIRPGFAEDAAKKTEAHLRKAVAQGSDEDVGRIALMKALAEELSGSPNRREPTLRDMLSDALETFATKGAYEAANEAAAILRAAAAKATLLEKPLEGDPQTDLSSFLALRELDSALFETSALNDLLLVGEDDDTHEEH